MLKYQFQAAIIRTTTIITAFRQIQDVFPETDGHATDVPQRTRGRTTKSCKVTLAGVVKEQLGKVT